MLVASPPIPDAAIAAAFEESRRRYAADPWAWLTEQVITVDEATQRAIPWPADKPYLREVLAALQTERLLVLPKSRRMLVTWLLAAWGVWHARHAPHHAVFYQSENEQKAAFIVDKRCHWIETHLRDPCSACRRRRSGPRRAWWGS